MDNGGGWGFSLTLLTFLHGSPLLTENHLIFGECQNKVKVTMVLVFLCSSLTHLGKKMVDVIYHVTSKFNVIYIYINV